MPSSFTRPLRAVLALGLALSLVASSCELTLGPSRREAGTYALVSVDGWPLPYTLYHAPDEIRRLSAETIELDGRGYAIRSTLIEHFWRGRDLSSRSWSETEYWLDGDVIVFGSVAHCRTGDLCGGSETGTLRGGELVLGTGWFGARRRYLRVSDCGVRTRLDPCRTADYTVGVPRPEPESP